MEIEITVRKANIKSKSLERQSQRNAFIIEGGGTKGVYAVGILRYLMEENPVLDLSTVDVVGGTSIGGIIAAGLALGLNWSAIAEIMIDIHLEDLRDPRYMAPVSLTRLLTSGYAFRGAAREETVRLVLEKANVTDITFGELAAKCNTESGYNYRHLIMNAVDLNHGRQVFMSSLDASWHKIRIRDAMLATSAIPFIFKHTTLYFDGSCYNYDTGEICRLIDGGLDTNNPLDYFILHSALRDHKIWLLQFREDGTYDESVGLWSMIRQVYRFLLSKTNIKMKFIEQSYNINTLNLKLNASSLRIYSQQEIQEIISSVYDKCRIGDYSFRNI